MWGCNPQDGFTRITLGDALRNCGRFDPYTNTPVSFNDDLDVGPDGTPKDMFMHIKRDPSDPSKRNLTTVHYFGDMHKAHLRDGGVSDWVDSVTSKIVREDPALSHAIRRGAELCQRIDSENVKNNPAYTCWLQWLIWMYTNPRERHRWSEEHDLPMPPTMEDAGINLGMKKAIDNTFISELKNVFKVRNKDIPVALGFYNHAASIGGTPYSPAKKWTDLESTEQTMIENWAKSKGLDVGDNAKKEDALVKYMSERAEPVLYSFLDASGKAICLPVGYASWPGMCILAMDKYKHMFGDVHEIARDFVRAFKILVDRIKVHTRDSIFVDGAYTPPWCKQRDGYSTAFSNMIHGSHGPIWIRIRSDGTQYKPYPFHAGTTPPLNKRGVRIYGTEFDHLKKIFDADGQLKFEESEIAKFNAFTDNEGTSGGASFNDIITNMKEELMSTLAERADIESRDAVAEIVGKLCEIFKTTPFLTHPSTGLLALAIVKLVKAFKTTNPDGASEVYNSGMVIYRLCSNPSLKSVLYTAILLGKYYIWRASKTPGWRDDWKNIRKHLEDKKVDGADFLEDIVNVKDLMKNVDFKLIKDDMLYDQVDDVSVVAHRMIEIDNKHAAIPTALSGGKALALSIATSKIEKIDANMKDVWNYITVGMTVGGDTELDDSDAYNMTNGPSRINERVKSFTMLKNPADAPKFGASPEMYHMAKRARFGAAPGLRDPREALDFANREGEAFHPSSDGDHWGYGVPRVPDICENFVQRIHDAYNIELDPMRAAIRVSFLGQPVTHQALSNIIARDDVFPFGFLLFRPYMTYTMASAILTVAGSSTGETLVGHADFQLADNVNQKIHVGHFTMNLKSVIYQPHHVWIADNVMATGYVAGNNCTFYNDSSRQQPPSDAADPSLYACLVPYDCPMDDGVSGWNEQLPNPMDITGSYAANPALEHLGKQIKGLHYASAPFYTRKWGWSNQNTAVDETAFGTGNAYNTLVFQGHQSLYNVKTGLYDLTRLNTGHRGEKIYPGCGRVWKGMAKLLEGVNYTTEHGGTSNKTVTTLAV